MKYFLKNYMSQIKSTKSKKPRVNKILIYHTPFLAYGKRRATVVAVYNTKTDVAKIGLAIANPNDMFARKIGKELAYSRAKVKTAQKIKLNADLTSFGKNFVKVAQLFAGAKIAQILSR